jgi:hypothetical protein
LTATPRRVKVQGRRIGAFLLIIGFFVGAMLLVGTQIGGIIGSPGQASGEGELDYYQALIRMEALMTFGDDPTSGAVDALAALAQFEAEALEGNQTDDLERIRLARPILQWVAVESSADPLAAVAEGFASEADDVVGRAEVRAKNLATVCAKVPPRVDGEEAGLGSLADYRRLCQQMLNNAGRSWGDAASFVDRHALMRPHSGQQSWDSLVARLESKTFVPSAQLAPLPPTITLLLDEVSDLDAATVLAAMAGDRGVTVVPHDVDGEIRFCAVPDVGTPFCMGGTGTPMPALDTTSRASMGLMTVFLDEGSIAGKAWGAHDLQNLELHLMTPDGAWNLTLPLLPNSFYAAFDVVSPAGLEGPATFRVERDGRVLLSGVTVATPDTGLVF